MNDKLREAFGQIHAGRELKDRTRELLLQRAKGARRAGGMGARQLLYAFGCTALLMAGGYWLYWIPTVEISIDINPSVQLGVNRFDRIVRLEGYNEDGRRLAQSLDLRFLEYSQGVQQIMENREVASLLEGGQMMTIAVTGEEEQQAGEILGALQSCTAGRGNAYCYYAPLEEVEMAREVGLSCGKYRAFLELQALDPSVTVEEVRGMSMREIWDRIALLSGGQDYRGGGFGRGRGQGRGPGRGGGLGGPAEG